MLPQFAVKHGETLHSEKHASWWSIHTLQGRGSLYEIWGASAEKAPETWIVLTELNWNLAAACSSSLEGFCFVVWYGYDIPEPCACLLRLASLKKQLKTGAALDEHLLDTGPRELFQKALISLAFPCFSRIGDGLKVQIPKGWWLQFYINISY